MQSLMTPRPEPLAVRPNTAAEMIGLSRAALWRLLQSGEIKSLKAGSARLITLEELRSWLARQTS